MLKMGFASELESADEIMKKPTDLDYKKFYTYQYGQALLS